MHFSRIQLKHIDFSHSDFSLTPDNYAEKISERLKASIQRVGILHPPILKECTSSSFQIISGRKRLWATSDLGYTSCDCYKVHSDISDIEALNISLEDSIFSHPLSPIEQAKYLQKAQSNLHTKELAHLFSSITGIPLAPFQLNQKIKLLDLEDPIQDSVHEKSLDEKVALEMTQISFGDRLALYDIISTLKLSISNQKKLMTSCRELAGRGKTTILEILSGKDVESILTLSDENTPQKAAKLMNLFHNKRFPRLSDAEKTFNKFASGLQLPDNISLNHALSFEKDMIQMAITFKDQQEFVKTWRLIEPYCRNIVEEKNNEK
jgi:ParB family chromosome partitioning protein